MARQEEHHEETNKAAGGKTVLLIVAAVLAGAALTGGVLMFTLRGQTGAVAEAKSSEKREAEVKKPSIYSLEPFIVNIHDGQDMRYLKIKVEFETTAGPEPKPVLDPYLAPLRDSILLLLTSKNLQELQDLPGKNRLRDEIMAAATKILPPGKITRVYFTDFVVQ